MHAALCLDDSSLLGSSDFALKIQPDLNEPAYNFIKNSNVSMVCNQMDVLGTPPIVTSDFVYLRLIEDRSISEKDFGKIQKDRVEEIRRGIDKTKDVKQHEHDVKVGIVVANNHFGGFGLGTVNMFRKMMDMKQVTCENVDIQKSNFVKERDQRNDASWKESKGVQGRKDRQTTLSDFVE